MNNLIFTNSTNYNKTGGSVRDSYREVLQKRTYCSCCNLDGIPKPTGKIFIKNANVPKIVNPLKPSSVILDCSNISPY